MAVTYLPIKGCEASFVMDAVDVEHAVADVTGSAADTDSDQLVPIEPALPAAEQVADAHVVARAGKQVPMGLKLRRVAAHVRQGFARACLSSWFEAPPQAARWTAISLAAFLCPVLSVPVASWSSIDPMAAELVSDAGLMSYNSVAGNAPSSKFAAIARPLSSPGMVIEEDAQPERLRVQTARLEGDLGIGETLNQLGASSGQAVEILDALRPVFDPSKGQDGDFLAFSSTESGQLVSFEYQQGRDLYRISPGPTGKLLVIQSEPPMERRVVSLGGVVKRSLADALQRQGERPDLVQSFVDIFAWQMDLANETRPGDEYRLVYEKFYDRTGFVSYGRILAAQYSPAASEERTGPVVALHYEDSDGFAGYYTPAGKPLRSSLLRAPLKYTRISSRYTHRRLHPVHRDYRSHRAVDFAAPMGTPVWSAGDGEVVFKGWRGGMGRALKIRHRNGYSTSYGHLSKYASGLKVGDHVEQKQVIGYVGMSGTATGPHLHYLLEYNGKFIDPLKVEFDSDRALPRREIARFAEVSKQWLARLREANPPLLLDAAM